MTVLLQVSGLNQGQSAHWREQASWAAQSKWLDDLRNFVTSTKSAVTAVKIVLTNVSKLVFLLPLSVVICENPEVENGRKLSGFASHYSYGSMVVFECDPDYVLSGENIITCQENSTWYPPIPTCKKSKFLYMNPTFLVC